MIILEEIAEFRGNIEESEVSPVTDLSYEMGVWQSMKSIILFPDTNFFFECRDPGECPWSEITDADQITLAVCRTVRSELDRHKTDSGRLGKRAKLWRERLRAISRGTNPSEIRSANPKVLIWIPPPVAPLARLPVVLDLVRPDDRIIAEILAHRNSDATLEGAVFFTDDGGASDTARHVGLVTIDIPLDNEGRLRWRLAREPDQYEKKIRALEEQVRLLKDEKPCIEIAALNAEKDAVSILNIRPIEFSPLATTEVTQFVEEAVRINPCASDFQRSRPALGTDALMPWHNHWLPPSEDEILTYQNERYPNWREKVEKFFLGLDKRLQRPSHLVRATFEVRNVGAVPLTNALVTIEPLGELGVAYIPSSNAKQSSIDLSLPAPPAPPRGKFVSLADPFGGLHREMLRPSEIFAPLTKLSRMRDAFYPRSANGGRSLQWECVEFRHQTKPKCFKFIFIVPPSDLGPKTAAVMCTVEGANLREPMKKTLRISMEPIAGDTGKYASDIVHGNGPGVIMLDGNWIFSI